MKKLTCYCLLVVFIFLVSSCHKDAPADPCKNAQHISAGFTIWERGLYTANPWFYKTDTIDGGLAVCRADDKNGNSYEWHIGAGVYYGDSVKLNYNTAPDGAVIPITLIVHQKPSACFPKDDSVATYTHNLVKETDDFLYYGKWQGYYTDSPGFISVVTIKQPYIKGDYYYVRGQIAAYNLKPGTDSIADQPTTPYRYYTDFKFSTAESSSHNLITGYILVDSTRNNITIDYRWFIGEDIPTRTLLYKYKTFKGTRL